jgi:hypothetical protein
MSDLLKYESKIVQNLNKMFDDKQKRGIRAHSKHIKAPLNGKETVKMFRFVEFDQVMELKSEPFHTLEDAIHFSECFNDNFLYESYCKEEYGSYYVYSGWIFKSGMISYNITSKGLYWEFSNWS